MLRVVVFLCGVGLIALAAGWLADRPGDVVIVWLGQRITTSVGVLFAALLLFAALAILLWSLLRALIRAPQSFRRRLHARRAARGWRAITRGLVAIGAGDPRAAQRHARDAGRLAGNEPLTWLLRAQSAQLAGDRATAEHVFTAMAGRADTKLLGLHGLYIEAQRRDDLASARALADEAVRAAPALAWAADAVLEFRCAEGDWRGALAALDRNLKAGLLSKATHRRQRAVLLTAQARSDGDRDTAKALALEATKLAPALVPAAALAGKFLIDAGEKRRAARILEAAWRSNPHPDLADAYVNLRPGSSTRERLARAQKLARITQGHVEGTLALARAAIEAQMFALAHATLAPLLAAPTQRVALLMAELAQAENDVGRAREWTARAVHAARDPAWTADGFVSETWMPVSPAGRIDAFEWKVPVAELPAPMLEAARVPAGAMPAVAAAAGTSAGPEVAGTAPAAKPHLVEPVIPLVHAPDDPGPEAPEESEALRR